jgi:hypothetical protein
MTESRFSVIHVRVTSDRPFAAVQAMQWLQRAAARGYRNVALMGRHHGLDPAAVAPRLPAPDDGPRIPRWPVRARGLSGTKA